MTVDKRINYEVQGGAKNYLGKQKEVTAPIKWKSSPDSPETELAYITKKEKDLLIKEDLHGSLNGDVNRGPSGIMSLDGYGSFDGPDPSKDTGMSGAATSDAEAGRTTANTRAEGPGSGNLPPGVRDKGLDDYRNAFIAAGGGQRVNPGFFDSRNTVSPAELAAARRFDPISFGKSRSRGIMGLISGGGIFGNLLRSLGRKIGFGKNYDEPTYDMSGINTRLYENIPGVSTNPNYLDIDNEFLDEEEEERATQNFSFDNTGMMSVQNNLLTEVIKQDLKRKNQIKALDYETAKDIGVINPNMTKYEFEQIQKGNITEPGTYTT
jgi:hypothetical protein